MCDGYFIELDKQEWICVNQKNGLLPCVIWTEFNFWKSLEDDNVYLRGSQNPESFMLS